MLYRRMSVREEMKNGLALVVTVAAESMVPWFAGMGLLF
jgi:hypothetical protein